CDACGQEGDRSGMTWDGTSWLCGSEMAAREAGNVQQFIDDVAACTQRQFAAEAARKAERAQQAAEPAQDGAGDETPAAQPAEAHTAAEDAPEAAADLGANT